MTTKRCPRCGKRKSREVFHNNRSKKDGLSDYCRDCNSIYAKEYRKKYGKEYDESHRKQRSTRRRKRYAEDEAYRNKRKMDSNLHHKKRYAENEEYRKKQKEYHQTHLLTPEQTTEKNRKRRAVKLNAEGSYTFKEWLALCVREGWLCAMCSAQLTALTATADHIIPLTRGGSDYISNIQPACRSCNSKKGTKLMEELEVK